eukprot:9676569-Alexandrium_andersonii.AAC.1
MCIRDSPWLAPPLEEPAAVFWRWPLGTRVPPPTPAEAAETLAEWALATAVELGPARVRGLSA